MSPKDAEEKVGNQKLLSDMNEQQNSKFINLKKKKVKFSKGDKVRIKLEREIFFKGYKPRFKEEIFVIHDVSTRLPVPMYTLKSIDEKETIIGSFYQNELTLINQQEHRIAKVLKKRGNKSLVKWRGYPERYNSWIPTSDIRKI